MTDGVIARETWAGTCLKALCQGLRLDRLANSLRFSTRYGRDPSHNTNSCCNIVSSLASLLRRYPVRVHEWNRRFVLAQPMQGWMRELLRTNQVRPRSLDNAVPEEIKDRVVLAEVDGVLQRVKVRGSLSTKPLLHFREGYTPETSLADRNATMFRLLILSLSLQILKSLVSGWPDGRLRIKRPVGFPS